MLLYESLSVDLFCERTAKALVRLRERAGSLEHLLFAFVINIIFSCTGFYVNMVWHILVQSVNVIG